MARRKKKEEEKKKKDLPAGLGPSQSGKVLELEFSPEIRKKLREAEPAPGTGIRWIEPPAEQQAALRQWQKWQKLKPGGAPQPQTTATIREVQPDIFGPETEWSRRITRQQIAWRRREAKRKEKERQKLMKQWQRGELPPERFEEVFPPREAEEEEEELRPGVYNVRSTPEDNKVITFLGSQESIELTPEEWDKFKQFKTAPQRYRGANETVARALGMHVENQTAGMAPTMLPGPTVESRNIWASTLREGMGKALSKGLVGAAAGAVIGGTPTAGIGAIPGAILGFMGTTIASLYGAYTANQKEEVKNAFKGFQGFKTGVSAQLTAVRAGALSPAQAMVNLNYAEQRLNYYESLLRQKQAQGDFIADVSDYDGKMAYIQEYRALYFAAIRAQVEASLREEGYQPAEIYVPNYEDTLRGVQ